MALSGKAQLMRRLNRSAVLDVVREQSPISPTGISELIGLTLPTVIRIIKELESEGLIRTTGTTQVSGGRPRVLVAFDPDQSAVVGLDLGGDKVYGTIANLGGEIQAEILETWGGEDGSHRVERLEEIISALLEHKRPAGQMIRGIGIGAPGLTDVRRGVITLAVSLGWENIPLKEMLERRFGVPVLLENDVNLAALGEYGFGAGKGAASLVCLSVGTGVGAGLVIDRKIYHGFHQSAGEIGYLLPGVEFMRQNYPRFGALESVASGTSLAARVQEAIRQMGQNGQEISPDNVLTRPVVEQAWTRDLFAGLVDYLAIAVASISTIVDPEVIVLGGSLSTSSQIDFVQPIQERLRGLIPILPRIEQSALGYRAAVMGAIMSVLDATTDHLAINRLA